MEEDINIIYKIYKAKTDSAVFFNSGWGFPSISKPSVELQ
jgi:hypothetical protein